MAYTQQTWADGEAGGTPITAAALQRIEIGIYNSFDAGELTGDPLPDGLTPEAAVRCRVWNGTRFPATSPGLTIFSGGTLADLPAGETVGDLAVVATP